MPKKNLRVKKVMLGCPEDVEIYLPYIKEALKEFNEEFGEEFGFKLENKYWKKDMYSSAENIQKNINKQLCDECNLLIAVFYTSAGTASASDDYGTFGEINYFNQKKKQVFIHRYNGKAEVDFSNSGEIERLNGLLNRLENEKGNLSFKGYKDAEELKSNIKSDLELYFKSVNKKSNGGKYKRQRTQSANRLQEEMRSYIKLYDEWIAVETRNFKFSFAEKAEDLIEGMQEDGSVQYYIGSRERFRTTPTASTLEALYMAKLLPESVRNKMQDWVYNSRQDPCDDPDKPEESIPTGHKPNEEDMPGWSWNEGVSVWATSKALGTLIMTGFYERQDVFTNDEIMETTYEALRWLAEQEYPDGGWGFQLALGKTACAPSVTMTALALRVITKFLLDSPRKSSHINLDNALEKKLSNAKRLGIAYLLKEMKVEKETGNIYWEYDGKPSLTGTVWVLDFINLAERREAGELYGKRGKIVAFCISKLPSSIREYEDYKDEVYFAGGVTKYKDITEYSKFYSYLPYHIPVIMNSGVKLGERDEARIKICIWALTKGKEDFWNGTDRSIGYFQHPTCFVRAMALSVVAFWMRKKWGKWMSDELSKEWEVEECDHEEN